MINRKDRREGKDHIQEPTSREDPSSKSQTSRLNVTRLLSFGAWILVLFWMLEVDCWTLSLVSLRSFAVKLTPARVAYLRDMRTPATLVM